MAVMVMGMETERGWRGAKCGGEGCEGRRGWVLRVMQVCFVFWGVFELPLETERAPRGIMERDMRLLLSFCVVRIPYRNSVVVHDCDYFGKK